MQLDAIVVGAGPNGLAAAIRLAQAGCSVQVFEANATVGGGLRSAALTRPGFVHDVGSAIHPMGVASPFFRSLPLDRHGMRWIHPAAPLAHPLDGGRVAMLEQDLDATAAQLGRDGAMYRRVMGFLAEHSLDLMDEILQPVLHVPRHPFLLAAFGMPALMPARLLGRMLWKDEPARALWAGLAAHSILPLEAPLSSAVALVLGSLGHTVGWPFPEGGAQTLADALAAHLRSLGGTICCDQPVRHLAELPSARMVLLDVTPAQFVRLAGEQLPARARRPYERFRYGMAAFKVDYALDGPVPWAAAECARAATVHVGGTLEEIAASERAAAHGRLAERPFVLLAQQADFDRGRAPAGGHTVWAYCHTPHGSAADRTEAIEGQIERFAPGFKKRIVARRVTGPPQLEASNANLIGGDIGGGAMDLWQTIARPVLRPVPYRTPVPGVYLCSASTPPGPGVHGMCGFHAAEAALRDRG